MKKSEKLLDAIGQIDDRLVEEAAGAGEENTQGAEKAGAVKNRKAETGEPFSEKTNKGKTNRGSSAKGAQRGRRSKKAAIYRWQGALAACAVLAVCVGIFSLLGRSGMLLSPFDKSSTSSGAATEELAMDAAADMAAAPEAAPQQTEGDITDSTAMDSAVSAGVEDAPAASAENDPSANGSSQEENVITERDSQASKSKSLGDDIVQEDNGSEKSGKAEDGVMALTEEKGWGEAAEQELCSLPEAESEQKGGTLEQIVVSVKESSADSVSIVIENAGDRDIVFGQLYEVEQLVNGSWQTLLPVKEAVWKEVEYWVGAGNTWEETIELGYLYGTLKPGQYRIVKNYELAASKPPEGMGTYVMYAEFTVSE